MIDHMAKRYGLLPSEVLERASTFDLVIMDMSITYENYLQRKDSKDYVPNLPVEELERLRAQI